MYWRIQGRIAKAVEVLSRLLLRRWVLLLLVIVWAATLPLQGHFPILSGLFVIAAASLVTLWFLRWNLSRERENGWLS